MSKIDRPSSTLTVEEVAEAFDAEVVTDPLELAWLRRIAER